MPKPKNSAQTFWSQVYVRQPHQCWHYLQSMDRDGYGQFYYEHKNWRSNRIAWYFTHHTIPDGLKVLHHCDTPSCCNPSHLWLGTRSNNMQDMVAKGRSRDQLTGTLPERSHVKR